MISLTASEMYFFGETEKQQQEDLCLHGHVLFSIGNDIISNEEWCVSAAALRFMRSVLYNHFAGSEEHMLPCCGHFMVASPDLKTVDIYGCSDGVDFDVLHEDGKIRLVTEAKSYALDFDEYRNAVMTFAEQVDSFYQDNPRILGNDEPDYSGFTAFWSEWRALKGKISTAKPQDCVIPELDFSEYICISEKDIMSVCSTGISYQNGFINFRECAYNCKQVHGGNGKCIGERDMSGSALSMVFYTSTHATQICFTSKSKFGELLSKQTTQQRFYDLQKEITTYGYEIRDLG